MKTILITGASQGIGHSLVQELASRHHHIIAVSRNSRKLAEMQAELQKKGQSLDCIAGDLSTDYTDVLNRIRELGASLDILINNAGTLVNKPFSAITDDEASNIVHTNLMVPFKLIRDLHIYMNAGGHIINIGSMGGFQGSAKFPGLSIYSASKGALAILTECLAEELKEKNIAVNCLALGAVQTEMLENAFPGYTAPVTSESISEWISDFSLEGNRWFNGKVLPVSLNTP